MGRILIGMEGGSRRGVENLGFWGENKTGDLRVTFTVPPPSRVEGGNWES